MSDENVRLLITGLLPIVGFAVGAWSWSRFGNKK